MVPAVRKDIESSAHHRLVKGFRIATQLELARRSHEGKAAEHIFARDSHLVKLEPAIVVFLVPEFGSDVSDFNIG